MAGQAAVSVTPVPASGLGSVRGQEVCVIPVGWKRESVQGRIVYISPSQSLLWSHSDLLSYLTTDGTCKCGLSCPLFVDQVFNFDPSCSLQRYASLSDSDTNQNNLCNQHRKLQALAHYRSMLKGNGNQGHHSDAPSQQQYYNHHLQQQHQQQQLMRQHNQFPNGFNHRPCLPQQQQAVQHLLQAEHRSSHVHTHLQNHIHSNHTHDASQHLVVNPSEVNVRELVTSYVNGNDTHASHQHPHPHHGHHHMHVNHSPPDNRQLHDVTAVTASITELIPSVGQLLPQMQVQHPAAHVQYSLILPQQILTMQPSPDHQHHAQHMLLSPQIVSSFPSHAINSPYHQQHHFQQQQLMYESNMAQSSTADLMKQRSRRKRGSKKVRTVAAILNLTT